MQQTKPDPAAEGIENFKRQLLRAQYDDVAQQSKLVKTALYPAIKKLGKCYPQTPFKNSRLLASRTAYLLYKRASNSA